MAQQEAARALASLLSKVARYSVLLGLGGSALQASLYTGRRFCLCGWDFHHFGNYFLHYFLFY
jgi:hypothetical protein